MNSNETRLLATDCPWQGVFRGIRVLGGQRRHGHRRHLFASARPYLPEDQSALREYSDLIRQDFETYVTEVSGYFRCLDAERARVFSEAQDVTRDYQTLVETVSQD